MMMHIHKSSRGLGALGLLLLGGCAALSGIGQVTESRSEFDGAHTVEVSPAFVFRNEGGSGGAGFSLGAYWQSTSPGEAVLIVEVWDVVTFGAGSSLHIKVDGVSHDLASIDSLTTRSIKSGASTAAVYVPPSGRSSKRYVVPVALLRSMVEGKRVLMRLDLDKEYIDALFSQDTMSSARPAMRDFLAAIAVAPPATPQ